MNSWRCKIYDMTETGNSSIISKIYDWAMLFFIILSIIPLAFREQNIWFEWFDKVSVSIFIIDYMLRWITADMRMPNRPKLAAFLTYPFTTFAIIDLLSILPSIIVLNKAFKLFRITRLFKILRVFKFIRYSKNVMFNVEESAMFEDFFDALYWATTTLTTVGYGDIYPATDMGRIISMLSAILGVAVIALPSGVITASYLEELREAKKDNKSGE